MRATRSLSLASSVLVFGFAAACGSDEGALCADAAQHVASCVGAEPLDPQQCDPNTAGQALSMSCAELAESAQSQGALWNAVNGWIRPRGAMTTLSGAPATQRESSRQTYSHSCATSTDVCIMPWAAPIGSSCACEDVPGHTVP